MSKKKKNPLEDSPDLEGFEDLLDMVKIKKRGNRPEVRRESKLNENFALLNLLEIEKERLEKLKRVFDNSVSDQNYIQQQTALQAQQYSHKIVLKRALIKNMKDEESNFHKNFNSFFNSVFS